jgi:hypothetical protein
MTDEQVIKAAFEKLTSHNTLWDEKRGGGIYYYPDTRHAYKNFRAGYLAGQSSALEAAAKIAEAWSVGISGLHMTITGDEIAEQILALGEGEKGDGNNIQAQDGET